MAPLIRVTPPVSVVIPVYNTTRFLAEAVSSVLSQTYHNLKLVVVDDGSSSSVAEAVGSKDPRLTLLTRSINGGAAAARNDGWKSHPHSKYVAFLDADDVWDPQKLELQIDAIERDAACVAAGCLLRYISADGTLLGTAGQEIGNEDGARIAAGELQPVQLSSLVVRREALVRIGGFDEALGRSGYQAEDLDLLARLAPLGRITSLPLLLGGYRVHPDSAMARHRTRVNHAARFVRKRIKARRNGQELRWDDFMTKEPTWTERRQDAVERCYRAAALWYAERRRLKALAFGVLAFLVNPRYTVHRVYRQRFRRQGLAPAKARG